MADNIDSLVDITLNKSLVNNQDTVDATEVNSTRTTTENAINLANAVLRDQDKNYASTSEPTVRTEGKQWFNTSTDEMNVYVDGAGTKKVLADTNTAQTLTNKTYTNPTFSPAGAKGYLDLGRDLGLKITNNSSNPEHQVDITFDYLTLYDPNGRGAVESQASALTLDVSSTGAGGRAESENSGAEQASAWYYIYVYSDGAGTISGLLAQASSWSTVISNGDNPAGSGYVRRIGAMRNDSGSDFLFMYQINEWCGIELETEYNIGTTTSTTWSSADISSVVPETATQIRGTMANNTVGVITYISPTNQVSSETLSPGVYRHQNSGANRRNGFVIDLYTAQTVYLSVDGGTGSYSVDSFKVDL